MPNANVVAGANRLRHAIKTLQEQWLSIEPSWNDSVRRQFEQRHLQPLDPAVDVALVGIQKLSEVLEKIRRDCSDRSESP
ncbi:MAG: hypothetical protein NVSMB9_25910 [Isosphaeraceae bacterium]